MLLIGTVSRVLYLVLVIALFIFILEKMRYIDYTIVKYFNEIFDFIREFDYKIKNHRVVIWFFSGMILADMGHIFLDKFSSLKNKALNYFR